MSLMGPEGIRMRMQALSARLGSTEPAQPAERGDFGSVLSGQIPGAPGGVPGGLRPMSPLGAGFGISPMDMPDKATIVARARQIAAERGISPDLFESVIQQESNFNPNAMSDAGAMGLGQLMPKTAAELGVNNPWDVEQNLTGSATYLKKKIDEFGSIPLGLAAYNAGARNVQKAGGIPNNGETPEYVQKILQRFRNSQVQGLGNLKL